MYTEGEPRILAARGIRLGLPHQKSPWRRDDRAAFFQVVMAGEYDELLSAIRQGDTVLDAGANVGCFSLLAALRVGQSGRIVAVEPDPVNATRLQSNLELNGVVNTTIVRKALYDVPGSKVDFKSGGVTAHVVGGGETSVVTTTVQALVDQHDLGRLDVVKVDIEGSEERILGAVGSHQLLGAARALGVEVHSSLAETRFRTFLSAQGYRVTGPRTERDLVLRLVARIVAHPMLTASLYRHDFVPVARRLVVGPKQQGSGRESYVSGVLLGLK